jgi:hypothetical protein
LKILSKPKEAFVNKTALIFLSLLSVLAASCAAEVVEAVPLPTPVPPTPALPPTPTVEPSPTPFVGGDCVAGSVRVEFDDSYERYQAPATNYFESYTLYCLWIPEGVATLHITVAKLEVDLDVYVGRDETIAEQENYGDWESNQMGTADEAVLIEDPEPGVYLHPGRFVRTARIQLRPGNLGGIGKRAA